MCVCVHFFLVYQRISSMLCYDAREIIIRSYDDDIYVYI